MVLLAGLRGADSGEAWMLGFLIALWLSWPLAFGAIVSVGYRMYGPGRLVGLLSVKSAAVCILFSLAQLSFAANHSVVIILAILPNIALTGAIAYYYWPLLASSRISLSALLADFSFGVAIAFIWFAFHLAIPVMVAPFLYTAVMLLHMIIWLRNQGEPVPA
jgi:hypothetical protein